MATHPLPAPRVPLDSFVARALHGKPRPGATPAPRRLPAAPTPLSELENRSSLASARAADSTGRAVVLCVTVATCTSCGATARMPGKHVLVRFDEAGLSNAVHYRPADLALYANLPRERREFPIEVPFCEACFDAGVGRVAASVPASDGATGTAFDAPEAPEGGEGSSPVPPRFSPVAARDGIEAQHALNDVYPGDSY